MVPPAELVRQDVQVERPLGARAQPEVPVEARRRGGVGQLADPGGGHVVGQAGPGHGHLADRARLHQLGELGVKLRRPPLRAHLHHPVVAPRRLDHPTALADGERERLLGIDVLARIAGHDRLEGVPVVGRGDDHGIDVLLVEDPAEILVPLDRPAEIRQPRRDPVAQLLEVRMDLVELPVEGRAHRRRRGDDLGILMGAEGVQDLHAAIADAEAADAHPVVGADDPARPRRPRAWPRRPQPARADFVKSRLPNALVMIGASGGERNANDRGPVPACTGHPESLGAWPCGRHGNASTAVQGRLFRMSCTARAVSLKHPLAKVDAYLATRLSILERAIGYAQESEERVLTSPPTGCSWRLKVYRK